MIPFREIRAARRDNAVYALLSRRLRSPGQMAMLATATVAGMGASLFLGAYFIQQFSPEGGIPIWFCVRWAIGETIWSWMAADHVFSELRRTMNAGQLREWRLTRHSRMEIAEGFVHSGFVPMAAAVAIWGAVEALAISAFLFAFAKDMEAPFLWSVGVIVLVSILSFSHLQTLLWASWRCLALGSAHGPSLASWAVALLRLAGGHAMVAITAVASLVLVVFLAGLAHGPSSAVVGSLLPPFGSVATLLFLAFRKDSFVRIAQHDAYDAFETFVDRSSES